MAVEIDTAVSRLHSKFSIEPFGLVNPDRYWPGERFGAHSIEQEFEVFRWMATTATEYRCRHSRWGDHGPTECLSMTSGIGLSSVTAISSINDLRNRFLYAFFSSTGGAATQRWRQKEGIDIKKPIIIEAPHYLPFAPSPHFKNENEVRLVLDHLLTVKKPLVASPNRFHPAATEVNGVRVCVGSSGFQFTLSYGYGGASWDYVLATTEPGEAFSGTLRRAHVHSMLLQADLDITPEARARALNQRRDPWSYAEWHANNGNVRATAIIRPSDNAPLPRPNLQRANRLKSDLHAPS